MTPFSSGVSVSVSAIPLTLAGCTTMADDEVPTTASSETTVMVGDAAMYPSRNIIENAGNSAERTTLVAAVKAADLAGTLSASGPFTVFAPTDAAFAKLPSGTVETLLRPENRSMLQGVLTYHVVPARLSAVDLMRRITDRRGHACLTSAASETLTVRMVGESVMLIDARGGMAHVTQADVMQSNGVIHITDTVLLPR